jgi:hypothetical protein
VVGFLSELHALKIDLSLVSTTPDLSDDGSVRRASTARLILIDGHRNS